VRNAVGDDVDIMVDANQSLSTAEAITRGRAFEALSCLRWEEPLPADDIDGYATLAHALDIPIATGENLYSTADFARFLKREALDIVQPDLRRAGTYGTAADRLPRRRIPHPLRLTRRWTGATQCDGLPAKCLVSGARHGRTTTWPRIFLGVRRTRIMRVFLTGSSGKIGSVVERVLKENGCEVAAFDVKEGHDMLDAAAVEEAMRGCDAVAHLAAVMDRPEEAVFAGAAAGMWHILQAAERHGIGRVVTYSSVNAMGIFMGESEPDFLPIDESHPCRPGRAYAMSKFLGEQTCRLFTLRSGISTICIRPPAVWTEEDVESIKNYRAEDANNEWTPYWEYGCFIHVEDLARATLRALRCDVAGHEVLLVNANDVSSAELSSRELTQQLLPHAEWRGGQEYESEPYRALLDNSKARRILGWEPEFSWRP
jgi:nucleoside-diphosphate-sugar epimerase